MPKDFKKNANQTKPIDTAQSETQVEKELDALVRSIDVTNKRTEHGNTNTIIFKPEPHQSSGKPSAKDIQNVEEDVKREGRNQQKLFAEIVDGLRKQNTDVRDMQDMFHQLLVMYNKGAASKKDSSSVDKSKKDRSRVDKSEKDSSNVDKAEKDSSTVDETSSDKKNTSEEQKKAKSDGEDDKKGESGAQKPADKKSKMGQRCNFSTIKENLAKCRCSSPSPHRAERNYWWSELKPKKSAHERSDGGKPEQQDEKKSVQNSESENGTKPTDESSATSSSGKSHSNRKSRKKSPRHRKESPEKAPDVQRSSISTFDETGSLFNIFKRRRRK